MSDMPEEPLKASPETFRLLASRLQRIFKDDLKRDLQHDEESLIYLDGYIERNKAVLTKHEGLVNLIGAFLGECLIARYGGEWVDDPKMGWGVKIANELTAFPFNKVEKRFKPDGQYDSIASFYRSTPALLKHLREEKQKKGSVEKND